MKYKDMTKQERRAYLNHLYTLPHVYHEEDTDDNTGEREHTLRVNESRFINQFTPPRRIV